MFSKKRHAYRAHAHTVPVKDLLFHLYHLYLYGWGWVEDVSKNIHAYRVRAVRMKSLYIYPTPTPTSHGDRSPVTQQCLEPLG